MNGTHVGGKDVTGMADGGLSTELRALIRDVIREQLAAQAAATETVSLSTDADLAAFVARLLEMEAGEREAVRTGRKRFRLARPGTVAPAVPAASGTAATGSVAGGPASGPDRRRIERGAVTERIVREAARAGQRLILGPAAVLTPLAADRARADGVPIEKEH